MGSCSAIHTNFPGKAVAQKVVVQDLSVYSNCVKKSCCCIQLFLPLLLTEIQGVSCSSTWSRRQSVSPVHESYKKSPYILWNVLWILCSNILNALGNNELKGEIPHPNSNSPNKTFLRLGDGFWGCGSSSEDRDWPLCSLSGPMYPNTKFLWDTGCSKFSD